MLPLIDLHSQLDEALNINNSDSVFSSLYYTDLINEQRAIGIRNEYNKLRTIDYSLQQEISCLAMELVDPNNCCVTVPIGCKILRTIKQIPNTIEFHHSKSLTSIGPVIITAKRFNIIDYSRVPYIGEGRTTKNAIYAFVYDNYIYIISKNSDVNLIKAITIRGIFEDPTSLADFNTCSDNSKCWTPNDPYPLNQWMWAYMKETIVQQLLRKKSIPMDDNNNANDDTIDAQRSSQAPQAKAQTKN